MAIREHQGDVLRFNMPLNGINLYKSLLDLDKEECIISQNLIYRNGLVGRGGRSKLVSSEVNGVNKITGLEALYDSNGDSIIIAVSNGTIKIKSGDSWIAIDSIIGQDWSAFRDVKIDQWGALDTIYFANGNDRSFRRNPDGTVEEAGKATIELISGTIINNTASGMVTFTVDGEVTNLLRGTDPGQWTANATSLASVITSGVDGVTATANGQIVSVVSSITAHLQDISTNISITGLTITRGFLGPPRATQFLAYQDRLLALDNTHPSNVVWSKPFNDSRWETSSSVGIRIDSRLYGMVVHSIHNKNVGFQAGVLFFGASGVYFFQASDMRVPFTVGDYTVYPVSLSIGVDAVKTAKWTPVGTLFLARDKKVYLLPFQTSTPIEVSQKITSNLPYVKGIERIDADRISDACAVYYNNYYIISFSRDSLTANDTQFYLEVSRLSVDDKNSYQPWYGPMIGNGATIFAVKSGPGDEGELITGDPANGLVYLDADITKLDDDGVAIVHGLQTLYEGGERGLIIQRSASSMLKRSDRVELDMLDTITEAIIEFYDLNKQLSILNKFSTFGRGPFYCGGFYAGETYHNTNNPIKTIISIDPFIEFNKISITILHEIAGEKFELYNINTFLTKEDLTVQDANVTQ